MKQLSTEQVNFIAKKIESGEISSKELYSDLLDHFCCVIEEEINKNVSFDDAYKKACLQICPDGLEEIQQELLNSKSIKRMKNSTVTLGIVAISTACVGVWFKMFHWPAANIFIFTALTLLCLGFLPMYFFYSYKQDLTKALFPKEKYLWFCEYFSNCNRMCL
ncbi:MAG: hypothetical protein IPO21_06570 [Bacteroidales bacterium]|nr:hypothetical protein [Bacteroidales bacterium]